MNATTNYDHPEFVDRIIDSVIVESQAFGPHDKIAYLDPDYNKPFSLNNLQRTTVYAGEPEKVTRVVHISHLLYEGVATITVVFETNPKLGIGNEEGKKTTSITRFYQDPNRMEEMKEAGRLMLLYRNEGYLGGEIARFLRFDELPH